ncbi:MAG: 23S rRNA (guanosine(2251)-2'-O)-methyltransferase RlmB [Deltaproteobacteria bacterium]|nr:23S rRNA (guanosine(2251)-2'-O)-methyltransferase RlmB [Deltaproteobacteria bacterium]
MKARHRYRRRPRIPHLAPPVASAASAHRSKAHQVHRASGGVSDLVFGLHPVRELIAATPCRICRLYVEQDAETRLQAEIQGVSEIGGEVIMARTDELTRLAGAEARHQGIVAELREYSYASLEEIVARHPDPLLLLDGVTDPRNLGAVLRAAECAGIDTTILAKDRTAGLTPAAIKSSAGAWSHLAIARCGNVAHTLERLKREGYWIAAMDPNGDVSVYELDVARRLALVLGSEGHGIRAIVRRTADFVVRIPLYGRVSSLNVSVAAAIALFEIARRRLASTA